MKEGLTEAMKEILENGTLESCFARNFRLKKQVETIRHTSYVIRHMSYVISHVLLMYFNYLFKYVNYLHRTTLTTFIELP